MPIALTAADQGFHMGVISNGPQRDELLPCKAAHWGRGGLRRAEGVDVQAAATQEVAGDGELPRAAASLNVQENLLDHVFVEGGVATVGHQVGQQGVRRDGRPLVSHQHGRPVRLPGHRAQAAEQVRMPGFSDIRLLLRTRLPPRIPFQTAQQRGVSCVLRNRQFKPVKAFAKWTVGGGAKFLKVQQLDAKRTTQQGA